MVFLLVSKKPCVSAGDCMFAYGGGRSVCMAHGYVNSGILCTGTNVHIWMVYMLCGCVDIFESGTILCMCVHTRLSISMGK